MPKETKLLLQLINDSFIKNMELYESLRYIDQKKYINPSRDQSSFGDDLCAIHNQL